ncbi:MAG TPA: AzlD domain-containing protein [Xanthobacteraceae bacterium]|nr:AzlD domain-containing protein [Xanthobacteraceae bacterium]
MTNWTGDLWPYLLLVLVGFLPNEIWRMLGLWLSHGLDEGSEVLVWVRTVATAVLAGVIGKLILFPAGALAGVPVAVRVAATLCGLVIFFLSRRSVFAGVLAGELVLLAGAWQFSP